MYTIQATIFCRPDFYQSMFSLNQGCLGCRKCLKTLSPYILVAFCALSLNEKNNIIPGQNLCVYRGEDGVVRCVDAYCPHLGANLAIGGSVCGNCIECPFHKWKFGEDGACVSVPGVEHGKYLLLKVSKLSDSKHLISQNYL